MICKFALLEPWCGVFEHKQDMCFTFVFLCRSLHVYDVILYAQLNTSTQYAHIRLHTHICTVTNHDHMHTFYTSAPKCSILIISSHFCSLLIARCRWHGHILRASGGRLHQTKHAVSIFDMRTHCSANPTMQSISCVYIHIYISLLCIIHTYHVYIRM